MFVFDPDGRRLGEFKGASVIDDTLYLSLKGFGTLRIAYDAPRYADIELQNLAQAEDEGKAMYTLDCDHRIDIGPEAE